MGKNLIFGDKKSFYTLLLVFSLVGYQHNYTCVALKSGLSYGCYDCQMIIFLSTYILSFIAFTMYINLDGNKAKIKEKD